MKKIYIILFILSLSVKINAQWVTIPDSNFVAFLQLNYPQCMNGNQMDTTCNNIVNVWSLNCSNKGIMDLTGLQYFKSLVQLDCKANMLTWLPPLPSSLSHLDCRQNILTSLPSLPDSLKDLKCDENYLSVLPSLPSSLIYLSFNHNNLTYYVPPLPNTLTWLECSNNQLTDLPPLPNSIIYLDCSYNQLSIIYQLPTSLSYFSCDMNLLDSLPSLPSSLFTLNCRFNQITQLPSLPNSLLFLYCSYNSLTDLPVLSNNLVTLNCESNQISSLPNLPNSLKHLICSNNQISYIPKLPDTMISLGVSNLPNLYCLPPISKVNYLNFQNTSIQCLSKYPINQNSSPPLSSIPVCDFYNENSCFVYQNINGRIYNDNNANCVNDTNEIGYKNFKVNLYNNGVFVSSSISNTEGYFTIPADTGTYIVIIDTVGFPISINCPVSGFYSSVLTITDSTDFNIDFAIECANGFDIGVQSIIRTSGLFFPANYAEITVKTGDLSSYYGLNCAAGISGNIKIIMNGPITYISEAPGALIPSISGDTLIYSISDYELINFNSDFRFIIQTNTSAQSGQQVCFEVIVTPTIGDNDTTNNILQHCFTVVNSFDPNAKEVYPVSSITPNQEWITYTIHFQNTGTAPAQHIYILDTLDNNLITPSFTLLSYSHEPIVQLLGDVIKFSFPNINLPDSTNDEPNSHGYIQYKVKLVQGLPIGTIISNTAYNFFDFNPPVATNTVSSIVGITSVENTQKKFDYSIYPNPSSGNFNIIYLLPQNKEGKLEVFDITGKVVYEMRLPQWSTLQQISLPQLSQGIYAVKISSDGYNVVRKLILTD